MYRDIYINVWKNEIYVYILLVFLHSMMMTMMMMTMMMVMMNRRRRGQVGTDVHVHDAGAGHGVNGDGVGDDSLTAAEVQGNQRTTSDQTLLGRAELSQDFCWETHSPTIRYASEAHT